MGEKHKKYDIRITRDIIYTIELIQLPNHASLVCLLVAWSGWCTIATLKNINIDHRLYSKNNFQGQKCANIKQLFIFLNNDIQNSPWHINPFPYCVATQVLFKMLVLNHSRESFILPRSFSKL